MTSNTHLDMNLSESNTALSAQSLAALHEPLCEARPVAGLYYPNEKKALRTGNRPSWRWMAAHPARCLALGFGAGLSPLAPGTVGTLFAWLSFWLLSHWLDDLGWAILIALGAVLGVWVCHVTAKHLQALAGRPLGEQASFDHPSIVWDEIIAFWFVLWIAPQQWWMQAIAFGLFRLFDSLKPPPIRHFDRQWKNGFGIMFDDVLAASFSLLLLAMMSRWFLHDVLSYSA